MEEELLTALELKKGPQKTLSKRLGLTGASPTRLREQVAAERQVWELCAHLDLCCLALGPVSRHIQSYMGSTPLITC